MIPHNACVEIPDDFIFKYARFVESKDFITIQIQNKEVKTIKKIAIDGVLHFIKLNKNNKLSLLKVKDVK